MHKKRFTIQVNTRDDGEPSAISAADVAEALVAEFDAKHVELVRVVDHSSGIDIKDAVAEREVPNGL